jgi:hypothetical protein
MPRLKRYQNPSFQQVSLTLGFVSLIAWFIPLIGLPAALTGIVCGLKSRVSENGQVGDKRTGDLAVVLNCLGLALAVVHGVLGSIAG